MKDRARPVLGWGLGAPPGLAALLRGRMLRHLDAVVAYSTRGAAEYAEAGIPVDRIYVAPNAVERPPVRPPTRSLAVKRPVRIVFVGRLQSRKRVDDLLQACAGATPAPELWIVGDGPDRQRLASRAARVFPEAVFTGALHGADLRARLDRADLFVLPGTGGLALQQAMARGLPVIAARGDGSQEDMVTPDNGWLVPPGGWEALAEILREALADPARLRRMGLASHYLAIHRFHPDVMVEVFDRALQEVGSR
jgi:glycosyltransferase involved in cell wall biosynthesis